MKKESKILKLGKLINGNFQYDGWKYNNEFNLGTSNDFITTHYSKATKPQPTKVKLVGREN